MASFNNCTFSGNLGRDPEVRYFEDGKMIANFSIAVEGRRGTDAMWMPVKVWGKQAQVIADYVKKGSQIIVSGELEQESWTSAKDGESKSRMVLNCRNFTLLGRRDRDASGGGSAKSTQRAPKPEPRPQAQEPEEDEVPF